MHASGPLLPALLLSFALVSGMVPPGSGDASTDPQVESVAPLNAGSARRGGMLRVAVDAEPSGLDPRVDVLANAGSIIARAIFDPLAAYDRDGEIRPYLAETITANDDATIWTIRLRRGIRFHDQTPLDAAALAAHFESARQSPLNEELLEPLRSVDIVDDLTVALTMRSPWGSFLPHLTAEAPTQLGYVLAPAMLTNPEARREPVGTGPFVLDSWQPDRAVTVHRNDDYWRSAPALDAVEFRIIPDATVRAAAFQRGEVDVLATTDDALVAEHRAAASEQTAVLLAPAGDPDVLALNTRRPPLDDVGVRRALSLAIDRARVAEVVHPGGHSEAMSGPYAADSPWYHQTDGSRFDPEEAARLIAGYESDHDPIAITLTGVQNPSVLAQQQLIQSMWAEVGVDADIVAAPQASVISAILDGDFDVVGWGGFASSDPDQDYDAFHSGGTGNITGYDDPALDAALDLGRQSPVQSVREAAYATLQERLAAGMPYIWLTSNQWAVIGGEHVRGLDSFTLPDGSAARVTTGPRCFLGQAWLDR